MGRKKSADGNECVVNSFGKRYRCTVQCLIFNDNGQFLSGVMTGGNNRNFRTPIQGGIDLGETDLLVTAQREMDEEMGIDMKDLEFISVILPDPNLCGCFPFRDTCLENIKPLMDPPFEYSSNSFSGCVGQYIFPLLFRCVNPNLKVNFFVEKNRNGFQTYVKAFWVDLSVLESAAPASKRAVMSSVCKATGCCLQHYYSMFGLPLPPKLPPQKLETYTINATEQKNTDSTSSPAVSHSFNTSVLGAPPAPSFSDPVLCNPPIIYTPIPIQNPYPQSSPSNGGHPQRLRASWRGKRGRGHGAPAFLTYNHNSSGNPSSAYTEAQHHTTHSGYFDGYYSQNRGGQGGRHRDPHYQRQRNSNPTPHTSEYFL